MVNTEYQSLETQLGYLAYYWKGAFETPELRTKIVHEYHVIVRQLNELGWDDVIGIESELPEELMPKEYLDRNPPFYRSTIRFTP